jgi:hypothetical protein
MKFARFLSILALFGLNPGGFGFINVVNGTGGAQTGQVRPASKCQAAGGKFSPFSTSSSRDSTH